MKKRTVLLVDDDPLICKRLNAALEKNGYAAILCASGEEALASLREYAPDAVILDVVLPNMDGLDVLKWIRNHPSYRQLPVIMLTCKDSEIETVLGLEMGADDYLCMKNMGLIPRSSKRSGVSATVFPPIDFEFAERFSYSPVPPSIRPDYL